MEEIYKELEKNFQLTTHTTPIKDVNASLIINNEQISKNNNYHIYVYVYIYYVNLHIINKWYNIFAKYEGYSISISKYEELMPEFINRIYNPEDAEKIKLQFETAQSAIKNVNKQQKIFTETTNEDILECIKNIDNIDTTSKNDDVENIISKNPEKTVVDITECLQQIHELNILKFTEQKACQDFLETIKNNINTNFSIGDIYSKTKHDMAKYNATKTLYIKYSEILISFKKKEGDERDDTIKSLLIVPIKNILDVKDLPIQYSNLETNIAKYDELFERYEGLKNKFDETIKLINQSIKDKDILVLWNNYQRYLEANKEDMERLKGLIDEIDIVNNEIEVGGRLIDELHDLINTELKKLRETLYQNFLESDAENKRLLDEKKKEFLQSKKNDEILADYENIFRNELTNNDENDNKISANLELFKKSRSDVENEINSFENELASISTMHTNTFSINNNFFGVRVSAMPIDIHQLEENITKFTMIQDFKKKLEELDIQFTQLVIERAKRDEYAVLIIELIIKKKTQEFDNKSILLIKKKECFTNLN